MLNRKSAICFAAILMLSLAIGCNKKYDVIPVKGTVTYDNQPVPNMRVQFQPDDGRVSQGPTNEDGTFEMVYTAEQMGVEPGEHKVTLLWNPPNPEDTKPDELSQKVLNDFKANGPIEVTIDKPEKNFEIKLPR